MQFFTFPFLLLPPVEQGEHKGSTKDPSSQYPRTKMEEEVTTGSSPGHLLLQEHANCQPTELSEVVFEAPPPQCLVCDDPRERMTKTSRWPRPPPVVDYHLPVWLLFTLPRFWSNGFGRDYLFLPPPPLSLFLYPCKAV